jgi:hypothetical protein
MSSSSKPGSKTAQVLDAIQFGHRTLKAISNATEISYRTVNALLYALEKQDRVIADDYEKERRNQVFEVLQYEAPTARGRGAAPRVHPTKRGMPAVLAAAADAAAEAIQCLTASMSAMVRTARHATTAVVSAPAQSQVPAMQRPMSRKLTRMVRRAKYLAYLAGVRLGRELRLPAADALKVAREKPATSRAYGARASRAGLARGLCRNDTEMQPLQPQEQTRMRQLRLQSLGSLPSLRSAQPARSMHPLQPVQAAETAHATASLSTPRRKREASPWLAAPPRLRQHAFSAASPPMPHSFPTAPCWRSSPGADFHF